MNFYFAYDFQERLQYVAATFDDMKQFVKNVQVFDPAELEIRLFDVPTDKANIREMLVLLVREESGLNLGPLLRRWSVTPRRGLKELPKEE